MRRRWCWLGGGSRGVAVGVVDCSAERGGARVGGPLIYMRGSAMTPLGAAPEAEEIECGEKWRWDSVLGPFRRGRSSPFSTTAALFGAWWRRNGGGRKVCASALFLRRLGGTKCRPLAVPAMRGGSKISKSRHSGGCASHERQGEKVTGTNFFLILPSTSQTRPCLAPRAPGESSSWRRGAPTVS